MSQMTALPATMSDVLAYFCGGWTFTRAMQGLDGSPLGSAEGRAEFRPQVAANHLHYVESGKLQLQAEKRAISFSRRFDYRWQDSLLEVFFADGPQMGQRYQHYRFDPISQVLLPVATHVCIDDHYEGRYQLIDHDHFRLQTRIEGPHKAYLLLSHFSRAAEA